MKYYSNGKICTCSYCKSELTYRNGTNIYSGGPFYCSNCGNDVTIDVYGKGVEGYYVVPSTGIPVFYKYIREASEIAQTFFCDVFYAYKFKHSPELVKSYKE